MTSTAGFARFTSTAVTEPVTKEFYFKKSFIYTSIVLLEKRSFIYTSIEDVCPSSCKKKKKNLASFMQKASCDYYVKLPKSSASSGTGTKISR